MAVCARETVCTCFLARLCSSFADTSEQYMRNNSVQVQAAAVLEAPPGHTIDLTS